MLGNPQAIPDVHQLLSLRGILPPCPLGFDKDLNSRLHRGHLDLCLREFCQDLNKSFLVSQYRLERHGVLHVLLIANEVLQLLELVLQLFVLAQYALGVALESLPLAALRDVDALGTDVDKADQHPVNCHLEVFINAVQHVDPRVDFELGQRGKNLEEYLLDELVKVAYFVWYVQQEGDGAEAEICWCDELLVLIPQANTITRKRDKPVMHLWQQCHSAS